MYYYSAVLLALSYELLRRRRFPHEKPLEIAPSDGRPHIFPLAVCALLLLVVARCLLISQAAHDPEAPAWYAHVPLPVVSNADRFWTHPRREMISACLALVDLASSYALYVLYRSLRARGVAKTEKLVLIAAYAIAVALAAFAPALSVVDLYDYVGYGKLGLGAYAAHQLSFPCPPALGETWCKAPAPPSLYGPLFLVYAHALVGNAEPTAWCITLFRIAGICWVSLFLLLLSLLEAEPALLAVAALNPMIIAQYVGDAHNDMIGVDLLLAALLLARKHPWAALLLCTAASLVKLPFALIGALAFFPLAPRARAAWGLASVAASAAASYFWGGIPYAETLLSQHKSVHFFSQADHWLVALLVLGLLAAALMRERISLPGAYAIPALAGFFAYAWYALWALPYIVHDRPKLTIFLIALPTTSFLMEPAFQIPMLWNILILAATAATLMQMPRKQKGNAVP